MGVCTVFEGYTLNFGPCPTHMSTVSSRHWSVCVLESAWECVGVLESACICQCLGDCVCQCVGVSVSVCLSVCGRVSVLVS